ncbi:MAG: beta-galactosidase trimerization domain-containing protein, partial [Planctomycetota bacterium]
MRQAAALCLLAALAGAGDDPYLTYVRTAPEFQSVDPVDADARWNTWIYMPWYYEWTIGHDEAAGRFCKEYGINGGFVDRGNGPLAWLEQNDLRFYCDHTAGKGTLYLRGANNRGNWRKYQRDPRAVRPVPIDKATLDKTIQVIK